ncbi:MAG TPA: hypothetical protein VJT73_20940 [Polyangiaceae bacterium]|nr:hypothetical protein [Polyangiaceae bacterium]
MKAEMLLPVVLWVVSCGGGAASSPPAEPPQAATPAAAVDMPAPQAAAQPAQSDAGPPGPSTAKFEEAMASAPSSGTTKVDFPPHAGVEAAIKAVPQGAPRLNMSNDTLQGPLLDLKHYEKCKVPRTTKVALNVAVYDGAAVGVDVVTKPKNAKLEQCLDGVVRAMSWDKVPSLNQVNVNF